VYVVPVDKLPNIVILKLPLTQFCESFAPIGLSIVQLKGFPSGSSIVIFQSYCVTKTSISPFDGYGFERVGPELP